MERCHRRRRRCSPLSLLASFPEYTDLAADPARQRWTIFNALTMTLGTDWDEQSVCFPASIWSWL
jgi:hypothetical protein